jgi:hypothetical protein
MDHARNRDEQGEKKLDSSWLHLYRSIVSFVRLGVVHISDAGMADILWK